MSWTKIQPPQLAFLDERIQAVEFGDSYFQPLNGRGNDGRTDIAASVSDEIAFTFFDGNHLPARWQSSPVQFCIAELGLGSGANLCDTLRLWRDLPAVRRPTRLDYLSFDSRPFSIEQLKQAQAVQRLDLSALIEALAADPLYPVPGIHRYKLAEGFWLTLVLGDVADTCAWFRDGLVDAWFLDGFAPARNKAMWSEATLAHVGRMTRPGGSFATFTAAGAVRRTLESAGFAVQKSAGFGPKRERLTGVKPGQHYPSARPHAISIAGAGVMGLWAAKAAQDAGLTIKLYDPNGALGGPGSGVLVPTVDWRPTLDFGMAGRLAFTSFVWASRRWRSSFPQACHPGPVTALAPRVWPCFAHWGLAPPHIIDTDWQSQQPLYQLPATLMLDKPALDFGVEVIADTLPSDLPGVTLFATGSTLGVAHLDPRWVIRGQQSAFTAHSAIPQPPLKNAKLGGKAPDGRFFIGTSFQRDYQGDGLAPIDQDDRDALAAFAQGCRLPSLSPKPVQQWVGMRAASVDRFPYYVKRGASYSLTCLGSHGFSYAPMLAEQWISDLLGAPNVVDQELLSRIKR